MAQCLNSGLDGTNEQKVDILQPYHAGGGDKSSINPDIVLKLSIKSQTQSSDLQVHV